MVNFRIIARVFSQVLIFEGIFMLIASGASWIFNEYTARPFFYSALITIVTGILVFTPLRNEERAYGTREGYIINTGIWLIFSLFGTLPFLLSGTVNNFADAFFESIAGFTTTNTTVFTDVESLPKGILFWRSLTQWLGGLTIIMLSLYVLPVIKALKIQFTTTEFSGQIDTKIHPKIVETAKRLIMIYILLTAAETILLSLKMPLFDAVCHSFSTMSTGGFSTKNSGIAAFSSPMVKGIITVFMFIAGTNLSLIYFAVKGNFRRIIGNTEFILYVLIAVGFSLLVASVLFLGSGEPAGKAAGNGFFHVISILTTTGFYTEDFNNWGYFLVLILFILMFTGGMSGSTSGGIKILRLLIVAKNNRKESRRLVHPNAFLPVRLDKKRVPDNIVHNLIIFISLYFITICAGTLTFSFMDFDLITSFSTTASMLGNIGPALGRFGPFTNYADIPAAGKLFLSGLMLVGRLELLTVIILFTRSFYKR
jgi:trk system potassium uptake protein TrkH